MQTKRELEEPIIALKSDFEGWILALDSHRSARIKIFVLARWSVTRQCRLASVTSEMAAISF